MVNRSNVLKWIVGWRNLLHWLGGQRLESRLSSENTDWIFNLLIFNSLAFHSLGLFQLPKNKEYIWCIVLHLFCNRQANSEHGDQFQHSNGRSKPNELLIHIKDRRRRRITLYPHPCRGPSSSRKWKKWNLSQNTLQYNNNNMYHWNANELQ